MIWCWTLEIINPHSHALWALIMKLKIWARAALAGLGKLIKCIMLIDICVGMAYMVYNSSINDNYKSITYANAQYYYPDLITLLNIAIAKHLEITGGYHGNTW